MSMCFKIRKFRDKPKLLRYAPAIRRPFAPALSRYVLMSVALAQCPYALTRKRVGHTTIRQELIAQFILILLTPSKNASVR